VTVDQQSNTFCINKIFGLIFTRRHDILQHDVHGGAVYGRATKSKFGFRFCESVWRREAQEGAYVSSERDSAGKAAHKKNHSAQSAAQETEKKRQIHHVGYRS
jgi:hypothetical protein